MADETLGENQKSSDVLDSHRTDEIEDLSRRIFGVSPDRIAFPGGKSRPVYIIEVGGELYILAKRASLHDAKVEAAVLKGLTQSNLVPAYVGKHGRWIAQEYVSGKRLPILIDEAATQERRRSLIEIGLDSLLDIQIAADRIRLRRKVPKLGVVDNWINNRIGLVDGISSNASIAVPSLNRTAMAQAFSSKQSDFVKWDSRPGNVLIDNDKAKWFDWEDCGQRNRLDDLVCFMADEWTNIDPDIEDALIETYLPRFRRSLDADWAHEYFHVAGCLQILFRLKLATDFFRRDGKWWDRQYCLENDKVGVFPDEIERLTSRLSRWSKVSPSTRPLEDWATALRTALVGL